MSDSECDNRDVEDSTFAVDLDDWGWDPSVDAFLEELVAEAPRCGAAVDFAWVSESFLEVLEPTPEQAAVALERFSPVALAKRWLYLQRVRTGRAAGQNDEISEHMTSVSVACESRASSALVAERNVGDSIAEANHGAGHAAGADMQDKRLDVSQCESALSTAPAPPGRDRVLDAMQSFLFGVPRQSPRMQGRRPAHDPLSEVSIMGSEKVEEPSSLLGDEVEPGDGPGGEGTEEPVIDISSVQQETSGVGLSGRNSPGNVAVVSGPPKFSPATMPTNGEALRLCLEELQWHGEALNHCAGGSDAVALAREAKLRRAAMFRYLSGLDVRASADSVA